MRHDTIDEAGVKTDKMRIKDSPLRLALMAVLFLVTVLMWGLNADAACVNDGNYTQPNGDSLVISSGSAPGTNFTCGATVLFELTTSTQFL